MSLPASGRHSSNGLHASNFTSRSPQHHSSKDTTSERKIITNMRKTTALTLFLLTTFLLLASYIVWKRQGVLYYCAPSEITQTNLGNVTTSLKESIQWSEIKTRRRPLDSTIHERWIIVTSISMPTEQVKKLSTIEGWKLIVVADSKTPENWKYVIAPKVAYKYRVYTCMTTRLNPQKSGNQSALSH